MTTVADLVCTGRPVDDNGQPIGEPCGRRHRPLPYYATHHDERIRAREAEDLIQRARAKGWAVSDPRPDGSRDVMCPRCRRPDPAIARGLTTTDTGE